LDDQLHQNQVEQSAIDACSVSANPDDEGGRPLNVIFKSALTLFIAQEDYNAMNLFIYYASLMGIPMN